MRGLVVAAGLVAARTAAACPCYSVTAVPNTYNCGVEAAPGTNPSKPDAWQPIFALVSAGPDAWLANGPTVAKISAGCTAPTTISAVFPCELLKAIAMNESNWTQFCKPTEPANKVGLPSQTIIAVDCGYGVSQVTSGMHKGETPAYDRAKVAGDPTYNLATGAQILAGKWRATKCVGDRQPLVIEDWYTATWAYNGLSPGNNPSNPNYDAMRPVCDPNIGCPNRPYQERVFGWIENPPRAGGYWTSVALAYPNRGDIVYMATGVQLVPALPEPSCAGPTDCVNHRSTHRTACAPAGPDGGTPVDASAAPVDLAPDDGGQSDGALDAQFDGGFDGALDAARPHIAGTNVGCDCSVGARGKLPHQYGPLGALVLLLAAIGRRRASQRR